MLLGASLLFPSKFSLQRYDISVAVLECLGNFFSMGANGLMAWSEWADGLVVHVVMIVIVTIVIKDFGMGKCSL